MDTDLKDELKNDMMTVTPPCKNGLRGQKTLRIQLH